MAPIRRVMIVGAGGFGREVASWIEQLEPDASVAISGFLDDTMAPRAALGTAYPYPVIGAIADYSPQPEEAVIIAIGDPQARLQVSRRLEERGACFYSLIHPSAVVARSAALGRGVILCPFALVSADAVVEDFVIVNVYGGVGHDAIVGAGSTLCPQANLNGGVQLGRGVLVGSGASILPRVKVGAHAVIGAGAVILRRVEASTTMYAPLSKRLQ